MKICDLHTHSVFSDGKYTPTELIDEAVEKGISAIALTDHNTVDGIEEFLTAAKGKNIRAIAGVELSTEYNGKELHIVGLFIPSEKLDKVTEKVAFYRKKKQEANLKTIERLISDGYNISYENVIAEATNGNINRVHISNELIKMGYIKSVNEGFSTLLSAKGKYYCPPERMKSEDAIAFLESINAVSVLAHPFLALDEKELEDFIIHMKPKGLCAIETHYSTFDEKTTRKAVEIAIKTGVKQSGGSDFHGSNKPLISLGSGMGNLEVPYWFVESLLNK